MCGKGSNTTSTTSSANPQAMGAYSDVLSRAASAAGTPYQAYGGEEVAPINQQQQAGFGTINAAQPGYQTAFGQIQGSSAPITGQDISQYESPYTNDVVNATMADFAHQNAEGQAGVVGNAAAQNALGGDRVGVAQALTAEGQTRAQAPVIAGLRDKGFQTALGAAQNQQRTGIAGGQGMAGVTGQEIQGGQAQVGAGTLQQTTQQAQDTQGRQDYYQKMGYPFQVAQYLAAIDTGVGSQMGGTSQTQGPTPNTFAQVAGLGLSAASMFAARGGRIPGFAPPRRHRASGGYTGPWGGADSWVPAMQPVHGKGPPAPPAAPKQQGLSQDQMKGFGVAAKGLSNWWGNQDADPGSADNPLPGLVGGSGPDSDYGPMNRGGRVRRYANGGFARGGDPEADDYASGYMGDYTPPTVAGLGATEPAVSFDDRFGAAFRPHEGPKYRLAGPEAMDEWRNGVDHPNAALVADSGGPEGPEVGKPPEDGGNVLPFPKKRGFEPTSATASLPKEITGPDSEEEPTSAMGYAGKPQAAGVGPATSLAPPPAPPVDTSWLDKIGIHLSPDERHSMKQALMQAGFAMMANTHGGPGSFLQSAGEAGMTGVGAYTKSQELQHEHDVEQQKLQMHQAEVDRPYKEMTLAQKAAADREKWTPVGSAITADGAIHPVVMNQSTGEYKDVVTGKAPDADAKYQPPKGKTGKDSAVVDSIVNGIVSGRQSPLTTGLYGYGPEVRAELERRNFDSSKATLEWKRAEKQIASLNGPQMTRFVGLASSVDRTIDEVRDLSKELKNSGIPLLNKAKLMEVKNLEGNSPKGQLAARYIGAVNTLKEEFANLAQGGYAPTESAWHLANEQINRDYGVQQLGASLDEVQRLVRYRVQAIPGLSTQGPGAANRYTGQGGQQTEPHTPPSGIPPLAVGTKTDTKGVEWYVDSKGNALRPVHEE